MKIDDELVLYNEQNRIYRKTRIKRINQKDFVLDYGIDSAFDIKYSYKTGRPINDIPSWNDFKVNSLDLETITLVAQESLDKSSG